MYCGGSEWNIIWHSDFFFVFLIVVWEPLHKCSADIYYSHCSMTPVLDVRGAVLPLKLKGNLVVKSLLELFSNKVYKEF